MAYQCTECDAKLEQISDDWFIDDGTAMDERSDNNKRLFHLCGDCRVKNGYNYTSSRCNICSRCWKHSKCGIGKWNENRGHVHCHMCGNLCYNCHGLLHYNK